MNKPDIMTLSRRERQIMDVIYHLGEATAQEVIDTIPEVVGDASIRKLIRVVEAKGFLQHRREGHSYIYWPTLPREEASEVAMQHTLKTFFQNSAPKAVAALLDLTKDSLSREDIEQITELINKAEVEGGKGDG